MAVTDNMESKQETKQAANGGTVTRSGNQGSNGLNGMSKKQAKYFSKDAGFKK